MKVHHINPNSTFATSDIISLSQGGLQTISIIASFTSGMDFTFPSTYGGSEPATGQAGEVNVILILTFALSSIPIS